MLTPTAAFAFCSKRARSIAFTSVITTAFLTMIGPVDQAHAEDPAIWRDHSKKELRQHWDTLEGQDAPSLAKLQGWLNDDAGTSWKELEGKVVLIDYWATWCGPCVKGIPHLQDLYEEYHEKGLEIIGVHSQRGYEKMDGFVERMHLPYTFAQDQKGELGTKLGIKYIPSYFIVDRTGTLRVAGMNRAKLDEIVKTLIEEPYTAPAKKDSLSVDESASSPAPASADGWPAHVEKELYADDWRGKKAPAFVVEKWLTDQPELDGKVLLVDFWATWCPPCRKAIPELNEFQKEFNDDLVIVGLSAEDEADTKVPEFIAGNKYDIEFHYAQAIDTEGRMKSALNVRGIPHVMIVDSKGIVRWQGFPLDESDPLTSDVIAQIIEMSKK